MSAPATTWWVLRPGHAVIGPFDTRAEAEAFRALGLATWARRDAVLREARNRPDGAR